MADVKEKPLSPVMRAVLAWIIENGGVIERMPGGFWVIPGTKWNGSSPAGSWTGTSTMNALVRRRKMKWTAWQKGSGGGQFPIRAEVEA